MGAAIHRVGLGSGLRRSAIEIRLKYAVGILCLAAKLCPAENLTVLGDMPSGKSKSAQASAVPEHATRRYCTLEMPASGLRRRSQRLSVCFIGTRLTSTLVALAQRLHCP